MKTIIDFLKNWTLPSAIVSGTVIYLIFYWVRALDPVSAVMEPIFDTILPLFMSLILFTTFLRVDFHKMRPAMWHLWVTVFQLLFIVLITALIIGFNMQGKDLILMEGILTCVICPGASAAPVVTGKLGGNISTMTTYTILSSIVSAVLIPLVFPLLEQTVHVEFLTAFLIILQKVSTVLLLPLVLGWLVQHYWKALCSYILSVPNLSFYTWAISLSITTGITVKNIVHSAASLSLLLSIAAATLLLCFLQFAIGRGIGRRLGEEINAGQALFQKNTALSIWVAYMYLNPVASIGAGCYVLWQNIINSLELWQHRKSDEC